MADEQRVGSHRDGSAFASVGERIDDSVTQVVTAQSRWLFDLNGSRFQRCSLRQDWRQALAFGTWQPYTSVQVDGDALVVELDEQSVVRADLAARAD